MGENPEIEPGAGVEVEQIKTLQDKLREQYAEFQGGLYSQLKEFGQKNATEEWEDYLNGLTQHLDSTHSIITQPPEQVDIATLEKISSTTDQFLTNAKAYLTENDIGEQKQEPEQDNIVAQAGEDVKNKPFEDLKEKMAVTEPDVPSGESVPNSTQEPIAEKEQSAENAPEESKEVSAQDLQNSFQDVYSALREYDKVLLSQPLEGQAITDAEKEWIKSISEYYKTDYSLNDLEKISGNDRVMMQARARDTVNYIRDLAKMLQREPGKGEIEKAEQISTQEPVKVPVEQKPETTKEVKIDKESEEEAEKDNLEKIAPDRLMARAKREGWGEFAREIVDLQSETTEFISRYLMPLQGLIEKRSLKGTDIVEKFLEGGHQRKTERLLKSLQLRLGNTKALLTKLEMEHNTSLAAGERNRQLAELLAGRTLNDTQKERYEQIERERAELTTDIASLEGKIYGYKKLVEVYEQSINSIAGGAGIKIEGQNGAPEIPRSATEGGGIFWDIDEYHDSVAELGRSLGIENASQVSKRLPKQSELMRLLLKMLFGESRIKGSEPAKA